MWVPIGTYTIGKSWLFTSAVTGTWFRLQHSQPPLNRRGLIAQASAYAPVELSGIKRLWAKPQTDVYQFPQPDCWEQRVIALRGVPYDVEEAISWTVTIEVWQGVDEVIDTISEVAEQIAQLAELVRVFTGSVPDGFSPGRTEDDQLDGGQF